MTADITADITAAYRAALREADEIAPDDPAAASDMFDALAAGTFYTDHEAAVAENIAHWAAKRVTV